MKAMKSILTFLFILLIHFICLIYSIRVEDRVALLALKSQITDPHGNLNTWNWNDSLPICEWEGITCGTKHPQRVVGLDLRAKGLSGTLSPHLGNLSFLRSIDLANNSFVGHIPPEIGQLSRLTSLALQNNSFEGQIPANLSRCFNLQRLGLGYNRLTGTIPSQLSLLSNLQIVTLQYNRLTGDLRNMAFMNMTSLQALSAVNNSFWGSIPDNIGERLTNLFFFSLGSNRITGTIPPSFYNLSRLQVIDLNHNQLRGTLPSEFGFHFPQLTIFHIGANFFHGKLPSSFSNLTQLNQLSVYMNSFTGKVTFSARNMPNLLFFELDDNFLGTGETDDLSFVQTLYNCSRLQLLSCPFNKFGGILPNSIGNLSTTLTTIDFKYNQITGTIPEGFFNLINLDTLSLSGNHLTGPIFPLIGNLKNLYAIVCESNNLSGDIPPSLGNLSSLSQLSLYDNNFRGSIPSSLGQCKNLLYLFLSENNLSGVLPPALFEATMLVELILDQNHLQGVIQAEISQLTNLVSLHVAENAFSGELPTSLGSCTSLLDVQMGGNFFTGPIPESFSTLRSLIFLNLSHNNLSGPIPNFLANFSFVTLNLSYNNFEGEVPTKGVFANSSDLVLSIQGNSKLCGGIPELRLKTCAKAASKPERKRRLSVLMSCIIEVVSLVVGGWSIVSLVCFLLYSRRKHNKKLQVKSELMLKEPFLNVSYGMLRKATDNFSEANLVGAGRFGFVYKGMLDLESNMAVAVKVIRLEHRGAVKSFMAECHALRKIRHRNLLKIITVCSSTDFQGFGLRVHAKGKSSSLDSHGST